MNSPESTLDPKLLERLTALKPELVHNGSLCCRHDRDRQSAWRLRVRITDSQNQKRRQLSIPVRQEDVTAIDELLHQWRKAYREAKHQQLLMDKAELACIRVTVDGGRRKKRYAVRAYKVVQKQGPMARWIMASGETYRPPVKPSGRPRKRWLTGVADYLMPVTAQREPANLERGGI